VLGWQRRCSRRIRSLPFTPTFSSTSLLPWACRSCVQTIPEVRKVGTKVVVVVLTNNASLPSNFYSFCFFYAFCIERSDRFFIAFCLGRSERVWTMTLASNYAMGWHRIDRTTAKASLASLPLKVQRAVLDDVSQGTSLFDVARWIKVTRVRADGGRATGRCFTAGVCGGGERRKAGSVSFDCENCTTQRLLPHLRIYCHIHCIVKKPVAAGQHSGSEASMVHVLLYLAGREVPPSESTSIPSDSSELISIGVGPRSFGGGVPPPTMEVGACMKYADRARRMYAVQYARRSGGVFNNRKVALGYLRLPSKEREWMVKYADPHSTFNAARALASSGLSRRVWQKSETIYFYKTPRDTTIHISSIVRVGIAFFLPKTREAEIACKVSLSMTNPSETPAKHVRLSCLLTSGLNIYQNKVREE